MKKNILLIRTHKGVKYAWVLADYLMSKGIKCFVSEIDDVKKTLAENSLTPENTLIHSRTAGPLTNQKIAELEKLGFKVINSSRTLTLTSNKYLSQVHARENGIPVADTYKIDKKDVDKVLSLLEKYGSIVLKPIFSQGQGIYCQKVSKGVSKEDLRKMLDSVPGEEIQVQQCINYKKLIRVIVIGYKALKEATCYDAPKDGWKCSVCMNPAIKKYTDKKDGLFELAERTARAFGAKINFIDFFEDVNGQIILNEINTACSLLIHEGVTGCPIRQHLGDFLIQELNSK
jgi:glutathione synthase/RimK-type ligase-like ATP-grasp enzyme